MSKKIGNIFGFGQKRILTEQLDLDGQGNLYYPPIPPQPHNIRTITPYWPVIRTHLPNEPPPLITDPHSYAYISGEAVASLVLAPGNEYLLTFFTRRAVPRDMLVKALAPALGDVLAEVPEHENDTETGGIAVGRRGGGSSFRASVRSPSSSRTRALRSNVHFPGAAHHRGRRHHGFGPDVTFVDDYYDDDVVIDDTDPEVVEVDDEDVELSGGVLRRIRLIAHPTRQVSLTSRPDAQWVRPKVLSMSVTSAPKVASAPVQLVTGKPYELRLLSALPKRKLARYLTALGMSLSHLIKTRPSVRTSAVFPALSEYLSLGVWTKEPRSIEPITPGFIIEEGKESGRR